MLFSGNQISHSLGMLLTLLLQGSQPTTNVLLNISSQVSILRSLSSLSDDVKIVYFKFPLWIAWVISLDTQVVKGNATHHDRFDVRSSTFSFL